MKGEVEVMARFSNVIILGLITIIMGCSGSGGDPVMTGEPIETPVSEHEGPSERVILGAFEIGFVNDSNSLSIEPLRDLAAHYNVTQYITPPNCEDCLEMIVTGFNPDGWVYDVLVSLRNPTLLDVYDARGTLLIGTGSDSRKLVNADEYTELFDNSTPPDRNPFKVFATDQPQRKFEAGATHEILYKISIPPPPNYNVKFIIDGCWPNNQKEPYRIYDQEIVGELNDKGEGTAQVIAYVSDWQDDVEWVKLDITPIGAPAKADLVYQSGEEWRVDISNEWGAPSGIYELWLEAKSEINPLILYDKLVLQIANTPPVWDDEIGITGVFPDNESALVEYGTASDPHVPVTYNIYCSSVSPIDFETVIPVNDTDGSPYLYDGLENGLTYHFAVRAMDYLGLEDDNTVVLFCTVQENVGWGVNWGGAYSEQGVASYGGATDDASNAYVTGFFTGTVDFDPDPEVKVEYTATNKYAYVSKFNTTGDFEWARTWGPGSTGYDIAVDASGNVYVTGNYSGTPDFDPGPGVDEHSPDPDSYFGCFLSKFDADGNYQWVRTWGGTNDLIMGVGDGYYSVAVDDGGYVYVSGHYRNTVDFDPGPGEDLHTSNGLMDIFLTKFSIDGDFQWARTWGGQYGYAGVYISTMENGFGLAVDSHGDVYVTGNFGKTVDFDPDPVDVEEHIATATYNAFLSKFDGSGDFKWVQTWGYSAVSVATDANDMIYVAGREEGGSGIRKYNSTGNLDWSMYWSALAYIWCMDVDDAGYPVVTGYFETTVDFDPDPDHTWPGVPVSSWDIYASRFDPSGDLQWARTWGGYGQEQGTAVAVDQSGISYIIGVFTSAEIDLDPGPGVEMHNKICGYGCDSMLVKVMQDGLW